ncbi:major facilitator superfamily [Heterobasidion irregulare TC 32-1]|uniref:Major facilitator superfamily n=1 Tax=Heterobasidion irregulare (strain TC 32-1) TaxID=747525 RepID=W4KH09_HETIT|nr:major facilitator superfamily [Heterobasidion irregulare TC 32-1]ETW84316.1 major facilitator superfamily [Heterobasidion irregulare TC 32-1]
MSSRSSSETRPLLHGQPTPTRAVQHPALTKKPSGADLAWVLAGLWSAVFLGALDGTIVATLMTPIGSHFQKSNQASYIGTSYLLSVCCFTPLYGRLSDILGRRGAMLLALTLFGLGTILCGLAPSMEALIAARAIAGMGGGGVMTVSSVAVTDLIPLKQRGLYQGLANILFGLGAGIGGPLGGWLNDTFGWRSAFLFQIPVLVFSFVLVLLKVSIEMPIEVKQQSLYARIRRMDFFGSVTLVGTVGSLLLGFSLKSSENLMWSDPLICGLFIASAVFGFLFVLVESLWAPYPVMPLRLITQRTPLAVSFANLFASMSAFSMYFTAVRLASSANAGLHLLPHSVALSTGSVFAGWIMRRTGKLYTLTLVSVLMTVMASLLVVQWRDASATWHLWLDIVPQGFGMASLITSTLIAMIAGVTKGDVAVATGITYLFRTTGQVLGVSLSGAVLQAVLLQKLRERIQGPGAAEIISSIRHSTDIIETLEPELKRAAISSYADALRVVFICQVACNVIAFLWCLPIQENPLPGTHEEQEAQFRRNQADQNRRDSEA